MLSRSSTCKEVSASSATESIIYFSITSWQNNPISFSAKSKDMSPLRLTLAYPSGRKQREGFMMSFLGLLFVVLGSLAPALSEASISIPCTDFFFNVSTDSYNDTGVIEPAASYSISATYCPPTNIVPRRLFTVQLLVHGGTSNKLYWSALAPVGSESQVDPGNYSYVDFVRGEGYHTISIDRLGSGNSSHPSPILVRAGLEMEQLYSIIQQIRGNLPRPRPLIPQFEKLILVARAYGGVVVNLLLNQYPNAPVDATILTAYVHVFSTAANVIGIQQFAPASTVFPSRFGNLDPGYVTLSNETNERQFFYGADGSFDPTVAAIQYSREDAQASGEQDSLRNVLRGSFLTDKSLYAGPLAVMVGQQDQVYCAGDCGTGSSSYTALTQAFFPNVSRYTGFQLENTGHLLPYHYSAPTGFGLLVEWLDTSGF